ncbi:somatostatin receptor type 2-like [Acanthaster planci]|uniref:Somatostatin receptor type 2-like n=1 Tax=Acanthaster planci TaxID=133434 RepID=A0A8B7XYT0_ACAPL|nr:somatostatin receptor type 2-like [Acanthaster planci]XP_022086055.1 somatostatin receptor type 2-like [Acanthaster planci]
MTAMLSTSTVGSWPSINRSGIDDYDLIAGTAASVNYSDEVANGTNQADSPWFFDGIYYDLTQLTSVYAILIILSVMVMVVGLTGNSMVIAVVCRHRSMRTPTNFYIVSLALSDFLVTSFVMPLKLVELSADADTSILNGALCSVLGFVQPYFVFTSIWTLVAISIDRYLVILHPLRSHSFNTRSRASRNVAAIWAVPFLVLAGYFYPHQTMKYRMTSELGVIRRTTCQSQLPHEIQQWYTVFQFTVLLVWPVGLLCFTCFSIARRLFRLTEDEKMLKTSLRKEEASRRKVAKMVLVVVFAFVVCWAPFFIVTLVNHFTRFLRHQNFIFWQYVLYLFGFSNSCMNPVIYTFMSRAFRKGFRGIIMCVCPCTKACLKNKRKFVNPRRSVTIISSEPATEHCRVGGEGAKGNAKRRRAAGGRDRPNSRWNNTQYSTVSESEGIYMTRLSSSGSANGGPCEARNKTDSFINRSPSTTSTASDTHRQGEIKNNNYSPKNAQVSGSKPSSFSKIDEEGPFDYVNLDEELSQNPPPSNNPFTDFNRNTSPQTPGHQPQSYSHNTDEELGCTAPLLGSSEDNSTVANGH